jgi:hypothetical protein
MRARSLASTAATQISASFGALPAPYTSTGNDSVALLRSGVPEAREGKEGATSGASTAFSCLTEAAGRARFSTLFTVGIVLDYASQ